MKSLLQIHNLSVAIDEQPILKNISLSLAPGSTHALMGPNGSGKSTLAATLMGHPDFVVTDGTIVLNGPSSRKASSGKSVYSTRLDLTKLSPDKRARAGLFLAFQQPCEIPGVTVFNFLKEIYQAVHATQITGYEFNDLLEPYLKLLHIDHAFLYRALNDGFSGGEKKRFELLQLLVVKPQVAILDEIDSGLDVDAIKTVGRCLAQARTENPRMSVLLITHYQRIFDYVQPDAVHVLCDGCIVESGDLGVAHAIELRGYDAYNAQL